MSIKINVGGTIFETTESTLSQSSFFRSYLERWKDKDEIMFIDRSPVIFEHILSYLRDVNYAFPVEFLFELDFFGIPLPKTKESDFDPLLEELVKINKNLTMIHINLSENFEKLYNSVDRLDDNVSAIMKKDWVRCRDCNEWTPNISSEKCDKHESSYCWIDTAQVFIKDLGWTSSDKIQSDQFIATSTNTFVKIISVLKTTLSCKKMVTVNDILLTHGHPVKYNNEWLRAREVVSDVTVMHNINVINLVLESEHEIFLKSPQGNDVLIVATMDRFENSFRKTV